MIITIIAQAIRFGVVFLYGSTGEIITEKSGHLNLGIPGVMCIGAVGGCYGANLAYNAGMGDFGVILITILFAMLFGGAMGALYGLFTISMRCNQNVTGLVITTFGTGFLGFWGSKMGQDGISFAKASKVFTSPLFGSVGKDWFSQIFLSHGALVYVGIVIAVIVAIVLKRTRTGMNLTAIGESPSAADAAGIGVIKYKYLACILGAAIAGIGGAFYLLDCTRGSLEYVIDARGWLAVALVIFCLWRPEFGILGSFVFGLLFILPNYVDGVSNNVKNYLLPIIPYLVTALVLVVVSFFNKRETQPPASLGVSYFREDR